jgi:phytoene dehydrogenase-like protein
MHAAESNSSDVDLVVVGGGLAGRSAAALVAQASRTVILFEQAMDGGGEAMTQVRDCIFFNLGRHALYVSGHAFRLMRELNIPFIPSTKRIGPEFADWYLETITGWLVKRFKRPREH